MLEGEYYGDDYNTTFAHEYLQLHDEEYSRLAYAIGTLRLPAACPSFGMTSLRMPSSSFASTFSTSTGRGNRWKRDECQHQCSNSDKSTRDRAYVSARECVVVGGAGPR